MRSTVFFLLLLLSACGPVASNTATGNSAQNENLDTRAVTLTSNTGAVTVTAEVADSDEERHLGLMNRLSMASDAGMFFVFDQDVEDPFWMHNTYISLDIIFISANKQIVTIAENTTPLSDERIYPTQPYRYVLEVNAGFADAHSLSVGDDVAF